MLENPYGIQYTGRIVHIKGGERRHVFNKKTGGALCGAGLHRDGSIIPNAVVTSKGKKVDCLRCIKILYVDHADKYIVKRSLRPSAAGKRYEHKMVAGGRQGFAIGRKKTENSTPEMPYGPSSVADFRRGSNAHPTQTRLASKRQRGAPRVRIISPATARMAVGGGMPIPVPAPRQRAAPAPVEIVEAYSSDRFMNNPRPIMSLSDWQKAMARAESRGDVRTIRALEAALARGAVKIAKMTKKASRRNPSTDENKANAAEAMSLFRSGKVSSLKAAWKKVKGGV